MQVALAIGAEVEAGAYGVSALWTRIGQRLAHQEVNDKTDEAPRWQENNHQNRPQSSAHSTARGIAVDVGDEENNDGHAETCRSDDTRQCHRSRRGIVLQVRRKNLAAEASCVQVDEEGDRLRHEEEHDYQHDQPSRNDPKLVPEAKLFLLPAKPDQPHPLVE